MPERCVDASVAIKWVIAGETWRKKARTFLHDSFAEGFDLIAPPLFDMRRKALSNIFCSVTSSTSQRRMTLSLASRQ